MIVLKKNKENRITGIKGYAKVKDIRKYGLIEASRRASTSSTGILDLTITEEEDMLDDILNEEGEEDLEEEYDIPPIGGKLGGAHGY